MPDTDSTAPPLGLPPRFIMEAQALAAGADPERFIEAEFAKARDRGFDPDDPEWRHTWETWTQDDADALAVAGDAADARVLDALADAVDLPDELRGAPPMYSPGSAPHDGHTVDLGPVTVGEPTTTGYDLDEIQRANETAHPGLADAERLPVRRRAKPKKPRPPQPKKPDPLAIRFVRQVLADGLTPGEEVRYDVPVSRSIISKKGREFAEAYGVKLSIRVDLIDPPDDPNEPVPPDAPKAPFLWAELLPDDPGIAP